MAAETEALVLGRGVAGLAAAIALGERGIKTVVAWAGSPDDGGNTQWAQGGIVYGTEPLDQERLREDIFRAGAYANYPCAVDQLVTRGPAMVRRLLLDKAAVPFERDGEGRLRLTKEGGHSEARIVFNGDETGAYLAAALFHYAQTLPSLTFLSGQTAVNLLMTPTHATDAQLRNGLARCFGAFLLDGATGEVRSLVAEHTVLATGGVGQLYLHNTNGRFARGDGLALAHRAGARLSHLEYLQFHPTAFFHPESPRFLVSEAVRGEGAVLVDGRGERFLPRLLPNERVPELAPRDRVARAIHEEMLQSGAACVYLDVRRAGGGGAAFLEKRFPHLYRSCARYGVHIERDLVPVVPAAHYHCGGVWTDLEGRSSVDGLWTVGEAAYTGLHGANRLASTSLLEGLVWGTRAGEGVARELEEHRFFESAPAVEPWRHGNESVDPGFLEQDWLMLRHTMWNYVGLLKTEARLERARGILDELARGAGKLYRRARLTPSLLGLRHGVLAARLILEACENNGRSLGCYQRADGEDET